MASVICNKCGRVHKLGVVYLANLVEAFQEGDGQVVALVDYGMGGVIQVEPRCLLEIAGVVETTTTGRLVKVHD